MNKLYVIIGKRIAEKRRKMNYSQEQLAEKVGLHRNYIGLIERAEKRVTIYNLQKIANALDLTLVEIFEGF